MKELSDWQLLRVRDALRAFHRYDRDSEGRYATWRYVWTEIAATAEEQGIALSYSVKNGAERLRQLVEGVDKGSGIGGRKYPVPKPEALEAIVAFVTSEELNLLTEDELEEYVPGVQAPQRLLELMRADNDYPVTKNAIRLSGQYLYARPEKDGWQIRTLFLQRPFDEQIFQVMESRISYSTESKEQALSWLEEMQNTDGEKRYSGWALLTPEDSLVLFMKNQKSGGNHRYLCLEEIGLWLESLPSPVVSDIKLLQNTRILMMEHEFGHDLRDAGFKKVIDSVSLDLLVFERLPGAF